MRGMIREFWGDLIIKVNALLIRVFFSNEMITLNVFSITCTVKNV